MRQSTQHATGSTKRWLKALIVTAMLSAAYAAVCHFKLASNSFRNPTNEAFSIYGTDFLCFYSVARLVPAGIPRAYDHEAMWAEQASITSAVGAPNPRYIFGYPPAVAALLAPLGKLPYPGAYYTWMLCSFFLAGIATALVVPVRGPWFRKLGLSLLIPLGLPFFGSQVLCSGQLSAVAVLIFAAVVALRERHPFCAGIVFSLGLYKPPLFAVYALLALLNREWRFLAGAAAGAAALAAASLSLFGLEAHEAFLRVASGYFYGGQLPGGQQLPPSKGMGLLSAISCLTGSLRVGWLLFVLAVVGLLGAHQQLFARSTEPRSDGTAALLEQASRITLSYFLSIQALNYDAAVLLVPALLMVSFLLRASLPEVTRAIVTLVLMLLAVSGTHDSENGAGISLACGAVGLFWLSVVLAKARSQQVAVG